VSVNSNDQHKQYEATSATDTWRTASGSVESIKYFEKCAASSEANTSPISPTSNCYTSQSVERSAHFVHRWKCCNSGWRRYGSADVKCLVATLSPSASTAMDRMQWEQLAAEEQEAPMHTSTATHMCTHNTHHYQVVLLYSSTMLLFLLLILVL